MTVDKNLIFRDKIYLRGLIEDITGFQAVVILVPRRGKGEGGRGKETVIDNQVSQI